jgi:2-amino-4-hydroxy-6-hydroxymethyldihydropteridine diphosphokinase
MESAPRIFLSLGSNIDPDRNLEAALALLREAVDVRAVSRVYETEPVSGARGPTFLNAAVEIRTPLAPRELKRDVLRRIEERLGRVRVPDKSAPRTIDLDLTLYGDLARDLGGLVLPDPSSSTRAYVAIPLSELAPELRHPVTGETLREIAARLADETVVRVHGPPPGSGGSGR